MANEREHSHLSDQRANAIRLNKGRFRPRESGKRKPEASSVSETSG